MLKEISFFKKMCFFLVLSIFITFIGCGNQSPVSIDNNKTSITANITYPNELLSNELINSYPLWTPCQLTSPDGGHVLICQWPDGNLVLYNTHYNPWKATWQNHTWTNPPNGYFRELVMQGDGNLVYSNGWWDSQQYLHWTPIWSSNTYNRSGQGVHLVLQNDGNLVLYTAAGQAIWNTQTNGQ